MNLCIVICVTSTERNVGYRKSTILYLHAVHMIPEHMIICPVLAFNLLSKNLENKWIVMFEEPWYSLLIFTM